MTRHVTQHDCEAPVVELNEVVNVTADVDARRRLVDVADLEPGHCRLRTRQQRTLHRVSELLLLLIQARIVDCESGLAGDCKRGIHRLVGDRIAGPERENLEGRDRLG